MPTYAAPGVYVEEIPSAVKPIAGVSTSTAGFIGVVPDSIIIPPQIEPFKLPTAAADKPAAAASRPAGRPAAAAAAAAAAASPPFQGATLCTNFTEYTTAFGGPSLDVGHR